MLQKIIIITYGKNIQYTRIHINKKQIINDTGAPLIMDCVRPPSFVGRLIARQI